MVVDIEELSPLIQEASSVLTDWRRNPGIQWGVVINKAIKPAGSSGLLPDDSHHFWSHLRLSVVCLISWEAMKEQHYRWEIGSVVDLLSSGMVSRKLSRKASKCISQNVENIL